MGEKLTGGVDDRSGLQKRIDAMYEASDARLHASMSREMRGEPTSLEVRASVDRLQAYKEMLVTRATGLLYDVERIERQAQEIDQAIAEEQAKFNPLPELDDVFADLNERLSRGEITFAEAEEALKRNGQK